MNKKQKTTKTRYLTPTHTKDSLRVNGVKPPFGYYGAKQRIAKQIIELLPPHNAWVEVFCGSAAVTLRKSPSPIEVINDLDGEIINLFRQLRERPEELCRAIALTPYDRSEYQSAREALRDGTPLERARRFLVASMMTVNSSPAHASGGFSRSNSYTRAGKEARVSRWYNLPERLEHVVERLRGVRVENRDAREIVKMFIDRPATLMYLDPPYMGDHSHTYRIQDKSDEFHTELLSLCDKSSAMVLVSGYENTLYNKLLNRKRGWTKRNIKASTRGTRGKDEFRTEVLWMNDSFVQVLDTGRIPIRLSATEAKQQKINPPRQR